MGQRNADDSAAGASKTHLHPICWGSSGIIYETTKMNFEKSFCEIYLFIYLFQLLQEVCPKPFHFKFSYTMSP